MIPPLMDLSVSKPRRRILALDGGGIMGVFSIEILARMEELLREHTGNPNLILADHFDFMAGTSTGAIISTFLAWGESVDRIRSLYHTESAKIFTRAPWWRLGAGIFEARQLTQWLRNYFVEEDGSPALLGSQKLKTLLLMVMRNATTGSAWPLTNNPFAKYNASSNEECNLRLPLWQLIRASAAAPVYFPAETIQLGRQTFSFIDGGITAFNNPALIAVLTAVLPAYNIQWASGTDRLHVISLGTGRLRVRVNERLRRWLSLLSYAAIVPAGLMDSISWEQDLLCRVLGDCRFGAPMDSEIGDLINSQSAPEFKRFSYVRYDHEFGIKEVEEAKKEFAGGFGLDNLRLIPYMTRKGREYAEKNVRIEHLL